MRRRALLRATRGGGEGPKADSHKGECGRRGEPAGDGGWGAYWRRWVGGWVGVAAGGDVAAGVVAAGARERERERDDRFAISNLTQSSRPTSSIISHTAPRINPATYINTFSIPIW